MNFELNTDADVARVACAAARGIAPVSGSKVEDADGNVHVVLIYNEELPAADSDPAAFAAAQAAVAITRIVDAAPRLIIRRLSNDKQLIISSTATENEIRKAVLSAASS